MRNTPRQYSLVAVAAAAAAAFSITMKAQAAGIAASPTSVSSTPLHAPAATRPLPAGDKLPTADEVRQLVDAGQYHDALRALFRILALTGPAAAPYDRLEMLMLRAECQLQVHAAPSALETLRTTAREADAANNTPAYLRALGLQTLIQKSPGGKYTPTSSGDHTPIDILDRNARKEAYTAEFTDLMAAFSKRAEAAKRQTTLPPYLAVSRSAEELRAAEFCAQGKTDQTDEVVKELAQNASKLMKDGVDAMAVRTQRITEAANRIISQQTTVTDATGRSYQGFVSRRQGLTPQDRQILTGILSDCRKIPPYAKALAHAFTSQSSQFVAATQKAEDVKRQAEATLKADYNTLTPGNTLTPNTPP